METRNKELEKVIAEISENYSQLKSLTVEEGDNDVINLRGSRYHSNSFKSNYATYAQIKYIIALDNVNYQSKSNLMKTNKWFASAVINIAKTYNNINFNIII